MKRSIITVAALLTMAGASRAQDGGKVPWKHEPKEAMKEARVMGRPMMMFFTSEG